MLNPSHVLDFEANSRSALINGNGHGAAQPIKHLGCTFGDLLQKPLVAREEIFLGCGRQQVGSLNSVTNHGKSTLIRNAAVSAACGRLYEPLIRRTVARRVVIIEAEDTETGIRDDIELMIRGFSAIEVELVENNVWIIASDSIEGSDLRLNESAQLEAVARECETFGADLIFVDTISQAFTIHNENDNSEIKEKVMKPLKRLAVISNAAVIAIHHIGKSKIEEGSAREGSHRARGASSFGDHSRVIFNLERDIVNDRTILSCPKIKGSRIPDHVLKLDTETRWFSVENEVKLTTSYELLMELFESGGELTTAEVVEMLAVRKISKRAVMENLKTAVEKRGQLKKVRHGVYRKSQPLEGFGESAEVQDI